MSQTADVCLILEGTYPYVTGGVSSWTHDLIQAQQDLTFHLVTLVPKDADLKPRFQIPRNVTGRTTVVLQDLPRGENYGRKHVGLMERLEVPLSRLQDGGGMREIEEIFAALTPFRDRLGGEVLLNSRASWELLVRMYNANQPDSSFLEYFWGWRALLGGLYTVLLCELPLARVYHPVCTGYAGLLATRARIETGRPVLLTEHGIYTNERRIEIAMAEWLHETGDGELAVEKSRKEVRDLWVSTFISYSRACYEAASRIITLYEGNQSLQLADGAAADRLLVIPNGIDGEIYKNVKREQEGRPPTIALIGRVVPIKDVKTYIRACAILRRMIPDLRALVMGPTDEDKDYYRECLEMVEHMGLTNTVIFTGRVKLTEHLGKVDVLVLTSISEAQPLVILEGGALGIPTVATDVGACREMLYGARNEDPPLGPGGAVTPLANPTATAAELGRLLTDQEYYARASRAIQDRLRRYYNKADLDQAYGALYRRYASLEAVEVA